ncbi:hypothetical protein CDIK_2436 [Cucumispora dikerogammari]|nr:hypothetical protein CDIK_2436 [Cucumispora dikerogammari]
MRCKKSYPFHSCASIRGNQRQPGSLKKIIKNLNVTNLTTRQIVTKMRTEYNCQIPYATAWSSIQSAKRSSGILLNNSYLLYYAKLQKYKKTMIYQHIYAIKMDALNSFLFCGITIKNFFPPLESYCIWTEHF